MLSHGHNLSNSSGRCGCLLPARSQLALPANLFWFPSTKRFNPLSINHWGGPQRELALHRLLLFIYGPWQLQQQQRASSIVEASLEFKRMNGVGAEARRVISKPRKQRSHGEKSFFFQPRKSYVTRQQTAFLCSSWAFAPMDFVGCLVPHAAVTWLISIEQGEINFNATSHFLSFPLLLASPWARWWLLCAHD